MKMNITGARWLLCLPLLLATLCASAAPATVQGLRMWRAPDHTRFVFDVSGPVEHNVFTLDNPHRVVVDLDDATLHKRLPAPDTSGPYLRNVRTGNPKPGTLRIVFDLKTKVSPKSFLLPPSGGYGHRLVIDMYSAGDGGSILPEPPPSPKRHQAIIAVDAGHGGEDPGAIGSRGTREKDVVLKIARELERMIRADPDMVPVMVRTGDYYVSLRKRTAIARKAGADLFVSIHADAFPKRYVRGSSVFALSQRGASSETARWLADQENAADLAGGVSLRDKDELLAQVLLDLSMTRTVADSIEFGEDVLAELQGLGKVHSDRVEQAGFVVLKSPDIPSLLVETAFISNPHEEQLLRRADHRSKLARAIHEGIRRYLARHPVDRPRGGEADTVAAAPREHVVSSGETLSTIARQYRVSLRALRDANDLQGSLIRVGDKLLIPSAGGG